MIARSGHGPAVAGEEALAATGIQSHTIEYANRITESFFSM